MSYTIFSIKPIEFEQAREDPFRFDSIAEAKGSKYVPFSGSVRKPIYFLFVHVVNWLLKHKFADKNKKQQKEIKQRLEKLFVICLKKKNDNLRKESIIGNSFNTNAINPFSGSDGGWVVQDCYRIYGEAVKVLFKDDEIAEEYAESHQDEIKQLVNFIEIKGSLKANENELKRLLEKLSKNKGGIFSGNPRLNARYRNKFIGRLKASIKDTNPCYYHDLRKIFDKRKDAVEWLRKNVLGNEKKYPFKDLNNWFSSFILAVDKDINGENSDSSWKRAAGLFAKIKEPGELEEKQRPRCWLILEEGRYKKDKFDDAGWKALLRKARNSESNFYDFKQTALGSLINESHG